MNDVTGKKESLDRIADALEELVELKKGDGGVIAQSPGNPDPPGGND